MFDFQKMKLFFIEHSRAVDGVQDVLAIGFGILDPPRETLCIGKLNSIVTLFEHRKIILIYFDAI